MSKEIDFEFGRSIGATHYSLENEHWNFAWIKGVGDVEHAFYHERWVHAIDTGRARLPIPSQWTIHNNTLPLRELSDEQYGKLRRAADAGGVVELLLVGGEWCNAEPNWCDDLVYRIKPKSEREVFVERCMSAVEQAKCQVHGEIYEAIFDAGCRFVGGDK